MRADELEQVSRFQAAMLGQVDSTEAGKLLTDDVRSKFEAALVKAGESEAQRAGQIAAFVGEWRRVNATDAARDLIDRTILKPALEAIDKQFKDQPLVDATLRQVLADRYRDMGLLDAAAPLQERALATRRRELGEKHPDTLTSISSMGELLLAQGKLNEAEPYFREALATRRRVLGEEHPDTLLAINNMGGLRLVQGKLSEAEPYWREALAKRRRVLGEDDPDVLNSINNMGGLLYEQGKLSESEPYRREALEKSRRLLGEEHPDTLIDINALGRLLQ
jgi:tetratricopeptide (TPR) repeat protein